MHVLAIIIILAAIAAGYWIQLRLFPWRTCPRCKGSRRIQGGRGTHRDCSRCGASGRIRRTGARKD